MIDICDLSQWQHYSIIIIIALIELWLGKTRKTKSGSLIELIFNLIIGLIRILKTKKE